MMTRCCLILLILAGLSLNIPAQKFRADSTHTRKLQEVTVTADRFLSFSSGNNIKKIDSNIMKSKINACLADILLQQSLIVIKSYGGGSLANASIRGAGPEHTAILWNGFNLQSSMNGQTDFSLFPAVFADDIYIQYGGPGAIWGNGAVGGAIVLNNSCKFNEGIKIRINSNFGSFHSQQQSLGLVYSGSRVISSTRIFYHTAENDFTYHNYTVPGNPAETQNHASVMQYGLLQENYFLISERQKAGIRFWYQYNDRDIPPSLFQAGSEASQKDRNYRLAADWQRTGKTLGLVFRSAYFNDYILYNDNLSSLNATSKANSWITETEARISLPFSQMVNIGINNTFQQAKVDDYISNPERERIAVFLSYKISDKKQWINAAICARQEFTKGIKIPFTPSAGIDIAFLKIFKLKAGITRNFRLPTFNEMYWNPGGKL